MGFRAQLVGFGFYKTIDIRDTSGWSMKFIAFERLSTLS
jgi:hypothetical protein